MAFPIASKTRAQIRALIAFLTGAGIVSTATSTVDTTSLIDVAGLPSDGDDEYNGSNVIMISGTAGNIGAIRWVSDFTGSTKDCTIGNAFDSSIASGDGYELWLPPYTVLEVNSEIGLAELEVYAKSFVDKFDTTVFTEKERYTYSIPSGFIAIDQIEYVYSTDKYTVLCNCDTTWSESVDSDVTVTIDTQMMREGSGCVKMVVAAGASAGDVLATASIPSVDISGCTEVELWVYSTVALAAADLQLLLDDTASCASALESLDIPATTAKVWTRHIISLANPASDTAIISLGAKMVVDKGAFTLYVDFIKAVNANSRNYYTLAPEFWEIVHGSTDYINITDKGLSLMGANTLLRINGYQALAQMSADSSTSQVDPAFIAYRVAGTLMLRHALRGESDPEARLAKAKAYMEIANKRMILSTTTHR